MKLKYAKYYDIINKIGEGSYGIVYDAVDNRLGKRVAIKKIKTKYVKSSKVQWQAKIEANGLLSLRDHPNIVDLVDLLLAEDAIYIIMEHVQGQTLKNLISTKKVSNTEKLFTQILSALDFAHKKSIMHLDIKPANILVESPLNVKVVDFGISKTLGALDEGETIGTPIYMSPEQINAEKLDAKSDIYSIGMTMLTTVIGKPIYSNIRDKHTLFSTIKKVPLADTLRKNNLTINNKKIKEAILTATEIQKANRFNDCKEFMDHLNFA